MRHCARFFSGASQFPRSEGPGATGALSENSSAALYGLLLGETTTFPTGTSAGGFSWTFDDTLHVPVRRSRSFGPMFAERPFTTGKGKLNVGAAFQRNHVLVGWPAGIVSQSSQFT